MRSKQRISMMIAVVIGLGLQPGWAHDLRITIPMHSELTPVQRLNRDGVEAIRKHRYEKAEALFYKAYLYDAADPFTLNNLGYISELQGKLDRAQKFYALASKQDSNAIIDRSNARQLEGKPMTYALTDLKDLPMRVNRMNVEAMTLLSQGENFQAVNLLKSTLALAPENPFTLNNLAVAEESTGDYVSALQHYDEAAAFHSKEPIVLALKQSWRGKPVSQLAADSARQLRKRMQDMGTEEVRATMLTYRGVSAANQNDWVAAKKDFLEAHALTPNSAFALNNLGYVAERSGDLETAQFYYSRAQKAADSNARIGLATDSAAEGQPMIAVANSSNQKVDGEIEQYSNAARQQTGPVELIPRGAALEEKQSAPQNKQSTPANPNTPTPNKN